MGLLSKKAMASPIAGVSEPSKLSHSKSILTEEAPIKNKKKSISVCEEFRWDISMRDAVRMRSYGFGAVLISKAVKQVASILAHGHLIFIIIMTSSTRVRNGQHACAHLNK
ncbi:hypothetical protein Tcan_00111 [Toxocara canis]|uniref:Uncharacterized protein n=1 Tax=Toxocara canis TaxID=6265 RepID=A0A0B2V5M7_TOXCA|nr:hypothetical protein Tcan_00111 [Toxocara canis]